MTSSHHDHPAGSGLFQALRASGPVTTSDLGLLAELPGTWIGTGFNLISLPDKAHNRIFRLKLNSTIETLTFQPVGGAIPNRGFGQGDIFLHGVHYLQQVADGVTHEALHLEPGLWLNVPATTDPEAKPTIVRQSTIPHGDSLLAQSTFTANLPGGPKIDPVSTKPTGPNPVLNLPGYLEPFQNPTLPPGIPPEAVADPNIILKETLAAQEAQGVKVVETVVLQVSTTPVGGIINIPFVVKNANATKLDAIFWIEKVKQPNGPPFMQLQYTQTVILNFDNIDWPHVSVATLVKQ